MEKLTLAELMALADHNLNYDIDVHIRLRNSKDEQIVIFFADPAYETVEIDYFPAKGLGKTCDEYWFSWDAAELCEYWGLDPTSTDWFVDKETFEDLGRMRDYIDEVIGELSPYKGE